MLVSIMYRLVLIDFVEQGDQSQTINLIHLHAYMLTTY